MSEAEILSNENMMKLYVREQLLVKANIVILSEEGIGAMDEFGALNSASTMNLLNL